MRLCVICDNYATHTHPRVTAWLDKNRRVTLHFTPTSCSWLNLVEIFFGIITRQAIRRGTFTDVTDLQTAIRTYIDSYNNAPNHFPGPRPPTKYSPKSNVNQSTTRDTRAGKIIDDKHNKAVSWYGRMTAAFTGFAYADIDEKRPTSLWIADTLRFHTDTASAIDALMLGATRITHDLAKYFEKRKVL